MNRAPVVKYLITDSRGEPLTLALPSWDTAVRHARRAAGKITGTVLIFGMVASVTMPIGESAAPKVTRLSAKAGKR